MSKQGKGGKRTGKGNAPTAVMLVVAGSYGQYKEFLHRSGLSPREAVYIAREDQLVGWHGARIVYVGEWWRNPLAVSGHLERFVREQGGGREIE